MTKKNRALALLPAAALVFIMLFSVLYITRNADHDCAQEKCSVCQQLEVCENTLHAAALAAAVAAIAALFAAWRDETGAPAQFCATFPTLVTLMVMLSN